MCLRVFVASVPVRLLEQTTEGSGFSEPQCLLVCLILFVIYLLFIFRQHLSM